MDKGDNYRERSPLDDRGRDRDRYRYSLMQYSMQTLQWQEGWQWCKYSMMCASLPSSRGTGL
jgi:hypothetical protein